MSTEQLRIKSDASDPTRKKSCVLARANIASGVATAREEKRLRGLSGARDEFHLAAIVQNLKTMALRLLAPPRLTFACVDFGSSVINSALPVGDGQHHSKR